MENRFNPSLLIDAPFEPDRVKMGPPIPSLKCESIDSTFIAEIIANFEALEKYYNGFSNVEFFLISVFYKKIAAKSNRILRLLCHEKTGFESTVGSRYEKFINDEGKEDYRSVVTYKISKKEFEISLEELKEAKTIIDKNYNSIYKKINLTKGQKDWQVAFFENTKIKKTNFEWLMQDLSSICKIDVLVPQLSNIQNDILVTFFPAYSNKNALEVYLRKLSLKGLIRFIDDNNAILSAEQYKIINDKAPYLICMGDDDFSSFNLEEDNKNENSTGRVLPIPADDLPTIGIFDTMFEKDCYLKKYVEFHNLVSDEYYKNEANLIHGTKVDSLLVEGHKLNPEYDDNCGYFKVLHFGVGGKKHIDVPALINGLEEQVKKYCSYVKVWNLSLGDERAINPNYVSLLGAKIDEVSRKYNVLFIVSGTNISERFNEKVIGAPADSFNALVVNSVISKENPTSPAYTRNGPILTFYQKPDVSYYGGDKNNPLCCYSPKQGDYYCNGTSFASPLVARKAAYLINKMHLTVECAKAMIIDAAYGWKKNKKIIRSKMGYGIVPITIDEVCQGKPNEIKMVISGKTKEQCTLIHDLPLMLEENGKFCYLAKLVFCYFTYGSRNQGVDYTDQEISVKFGQSFKKMDLRDNREHYRIDSINEDKQGYDKGCVGENSAIKKYGKWNNTKILIKQRILMNSEPDYTVSPWWGISIGHLDRFASISADTWKNNPDSVSVRFGLIATFKTFDGSDADVESYIKKIRLNDKYFVKEIRMEVENKIAIQENIDEELE